MELVPGLQAPDFTLPCDAGRRVSLADFKGRKLVLCPVDAQDAFKARPGLTIPLASDEPHRMKVEGHAEDVLQAAKSL